MSVRHVEFGPAWAPGAGILFSVWLKGDAGEFGELMQCEGVERGSRLRAGRLGQKLRREGG